MLTGPCFLLFPSENSLILWKDGGFLRLVLVCFVPANYFSIEVSNRSSFPIIYCLTGFTFCCYQSAVNIIISSFPRKTLVQFRLWWLIFLLVVCSSLFPSGEHRPRHQGRDPEEPGGALPGDLWPGPEEDLRPDGERLLRPFPEVRAVPGAAGQLSSWSEGWGVGRFQTAVSLQENMRKELLIFKEKKVKYF